MVYTSEATGHGGLPIHRALVRQLLQSGMARGATVLRGIWGLHGNHQPRGDKLFQLARRVPVVTIIIDTPEWIERSFDIVDELTADTTVVRSVALSFDVADLAGKPRLHGCVRYAAP